MERYWSTTLTDSAFFCPKEALRLDFSPEDCDKSQ
jgi:hypothetical protein